MHSEPLCFHYVTFQAVKAQVTTTWTMNRIKMLYKPDFAGDFTASHFSGLKPGPNAYI